MTLIWNHAEEKHLLREASGPLGRYIGSLAARVETAAKGRCPVGTPESTGKPGYVGGRLRSSINWRIELEGDELVGIIGTNVEYAIYVHEGTRYMAARPFLVDGLQAVTGSRGSRA